MRDVVGSEGVFFHVGYQGTPTWLKPRNTGQVDGQQTAWTLSDPVSAAELCVGLAGRRFTFVAGGKTSDFQLCDFYVDPR